jgi:hypothetical protein
MNKRNLLTWATETGTTVGDLMGHYDGRICEYASEVHPQGREGLSVEQAEEVRREDASLLYVELTDAEEAEQVATERRVAEAQ